MFWSACTTASADRLGRALICQLSPETVNAHDVEYFDGLLVRVCFDLVHLLTRRNVPQPHASRVAGRVDEERRLGRTALALARCRLDRRHHLDQPDRLDRLEDRHHPPQCTLLAVPDRHNAISRSADDRRAIVADRETANDRDVRLEDVIAFARPQIPHADLAVLGRADKPRPRTRKCDVEAQRRDDAGRMRVEDVRAVPARRVPDLDDAVRRARREERAGRVRDRDGDGRIVGARHDRTGRGIVFGGGESVERDRQRASSDQKRALALDRCRCDGESSDSRVLHVQLDPELPHARPRKLRSQRQSRSRSREPHPRRRRRKARLRRH